VQWPATSQSLAEKLGELINGSGPGVRIERGAVTAESDTSAVVSFTFNRPFSLPPVVLIQEVSDGITESVNYRYAPTHVTTAGADVHCRDKTGTALQSTGVKFAWLAIGVG
jgi:hypothetical protein